MFSGYHLRKSFDDEMNFFLQVLVRTSGFYYNHFSVFTDNKTHINPTLNPHFLYDFQLSKFFSDVIIGFILKTVALLFFGDFLTARKNGNVLDDGKRYL